ncbi:MAG: Transcriptional regulator, LysR family [Myxococcaceae bacterium]|nr:Transcriptional regulator, LysR family [Myxococcaceae bacterium]
MNTVHARDLDLNLLPVLLAVADTGSVTAAAARLYLTQSAVSAALGRLRSAIGESLVRRHGRGVVLTERGARLVADARPHLDALVQAALLPARFDPRTTDATLKLGLSDIADEWLLPPLLRFFENEAPQLRLVCSAIQFRTVHEALATRRIDLAVTVADELPASVARQTLVRSGFVCLFDPRFVRLGARPSERAYLAQDHVIVSYNGDLRGVIEESFGRERRVRCSVGSFSSIGAIVDGGPLVATIPLIFAAHILALRPHLRTATLPFAHAPGNIDLLWPTALDADPACRFVREAVIRISEAQEKHSRKRAASRAVGRLSRPLAPSRVDPRV